jgi:hypothetical protein
VSMSHWTVLGSLSGPWLTWVPFAGVPHVALVGAQVPSCGPMVLLLPVWFRVLASLLSGVAVLSGVSGASGAAGAAGVPVVVPVSVVLVWAGGLAGSGLVSVLGAPVAVWLMGVVCGVVLRCAAVPGFWAVSCVVCWVCGVLVSGFSGCRGGGVPYCHGYAQCCGDDGVEDARGCPAFS